MRKLLLTMAAGVLCSSVFAFGFGSGSSDNALNIGVVDQLAVFNAVPQGQAKLDTFAKDLQAKGQDLQKQSESLKAEQQDFEKNKASMSADQIKAKQQELGQKMQGLQQQAITLRQSEMQNQQTVVADFKKDLEAASSEVAKDKNLDILFAKDTVPYANEKFDVTPLVIDQLKKDTADTKKS